MSLVRCFVLFFIIALSAHAQPKFEVSVLENGRRRPLEVSQKARWSWRVNREKVRVLGVTVVLTSSRFSAFSKAKGRHRPTKAVLKGDQLFVRLFRLSEDIVLRSGSRKLMLRLSGSFESQRPIKEKNCKKYSLTLRQQKKKLMPFYVGASCQRDKKGLSVSVTFPGEASLTSSTLFETKGKGTSWRFYELGKTKIAAGMIGKISLSYRGNSYDFVLKSTRKDRKKIIEKIKGVTIVAGAGFSLFSISGSDIDASSSKPSLLLRIPHFPIVKGLGVGLDLDVAIPIMKGADSISLSQFEIYGDYELKLGKKFRLRPRVGYLVSSHSHERTGIGLSANEISFGLASELQVSKNAYFALNGMMCGLFTPAIQMHYLGDLAFLYKKPGSAGYGAGARLQSFSVVSSLGVERKFQQLLFYAALLL